MNYLLSRASPVKRECSLESDFLRDKEVVLAEALKEDSAFVKTWQALLRKGLDPSNTLIMHDDKGKRIPVICPSEMNAKFTDNILSTDIAGLSRVIKVGGRYYLTDESCVSGVRCQKNHNYFAVCGHRSYLTTDGDKHIKEAELLW